MFDLQAFTATLFEIRSDLERVELAVRWLAPVAYEQRSGGSGGGLADCDVCGHPCQCPGTKGCHGVGITNGQPCDECVVAVLGDVGEIVLRRHHIADSLAVLAKDADRIWDVARGMDTRVGRLANLIDRGASRLPGITAPTEDPRDVLHQLNRREARVKRGEDLPAMPTVAQAAKKRLQEKAAQEKRIEEARAKMEGDGTKTGNRWRK